MLVNDGGNIRGKAVHRYSVGVGIITKKDEAPIVRQHASETPGILRYSRIVGFHHEALSTIDDKDRISSNADLRVGNSSEEFACFYGMHDCTTGLNVNIFGLSRFSVLRRAAMPW